MYLFIYLFYYDRNQSVPGKNELCSIFLGESAKAMISGSSLKKRWISYKVFPWRLKMMNFVFITTEELYNSQLSAQ